MGAIIQKVVFSCSEGHKQTFEHVSTDILLSDVCPHCDKKIAAIELDGLGKKINSKTKPEILGYEEF